MQRILRTSCAVLCFGLLASAVVANDPAGTYRMEVESIVSEESMLVARYLITAPRQVQYVLTRNGSRNAGQIGPARDYKGGGVKAKLTVVAAVNHTGGDTRLHLFKMETADGSTGGPVTGTIRPQQMLKEMISLTAKSGDYKIGESLNLGTCDGAAVTLLIEESTRPLPDLRLTKDQVTPEAISKMAGQHYGTVTLADARFTGEIVERLRHVGSIRQLSLYGTGLSGQVPRLRNVPALKGLKIGAPLNGHDLEAIAQMTQLERLGLPQNLTINVVGAQEIARLVNLKSLRLYNVNIDDAAFLELRTLVHLEELDLTHTRVTDAGLKTIEKMPALRILELYRHPQWHLKQQLSDACLTSVARLTSLERLSLSGKITDEGLKQVGSLPKLKVLSILGTAVSGAGLKAIENSNIEYLSVGTHQVRDTPSTLESLKKCRKLKGIHVNGQDFSNESELQKSLPKLGWSSSS